MSEENDVLDLKNLKRRFFYSFEKKPKILCVIDDYFSINHEKIICLAPHLNHFSIEIYSESDLDKVNDFSLFNAIWGFGTPISERYKNKNLVIMATCFNELFSNLDFYSFISSNNPEIYGNEIFRTNDFVDLLTYGHDALIERRGFKVLVFDDYFKDKLKESNYDQLF